MNPVHQPSDLAVIGANSVCATAARTDVVVLVGSQESASVDGGEGQATTCCQPQPRRICEREPKLRPNWSSKLRPNCSPKRRGLSLLEVLLSLAILGASLLVIGHLINIGLRGAQQGQLRTKGNNYAQTKMAEVAAGVIELSSAGAQPIEEDADWTYAVDVTDSDQLGLLSVVVTVNYTRGLGHEISVTRWIADPEYDPDAEQEE